MQDDRIVGLENDVTALREALAELVQTLEPVPADDLTSDHMARSVHRAHQILLATRH